MSRYSVDLLCEPHKEDYICSICQDVLDDPRETPCRHLFCRTCIKALKNPDCPLCRQLILKLKPTLPAFKNILNKLQMRCKFKECRCVMPLENYLSHIEKCDYKIVECPFANCAKKGHQKDLNLHKLQCEFRDIQCPLGCGKEIVWKDTQDHIEYYCKKGNRRCRRCKLQNIDKSHDCVAYLLSVLAEKEQVNQCLQQQVQQMTQESGIRLLEGMRIDDAEKRLKEEVLRLRQEIASHSGMFQNYQLLQQEVLALRQDNVKQKYELEALKFEDINLQSLKNEADLLREEVALLRQENGALKRQMAR